MIADAKFFFHSNLFNKLLGDRFRHINTFLSIYFEMPFER